VAAERLEANPEDLEIKDRKVYVKGSPEKAVALASVARAAHASRRGSIVGTSTRLREETLPPPEVARGRVDSPCYATQVAEVEVDPETGSVRLLSYAAAHDIGFALNPANVEGQIEGGVVFGAGYALTEEVICRDGKTANANLLDYRLPTALDAPNVQSLLVEEASDYGPYGAKGIGEPPVVPVAPAIANAIYDAIGVRVTELPITPEKIVMAMKKQAVEK